MMRDPDRIDPMLDLLAQVWKQNPDWRLGQVIVNATDKATFHVEDNDMRDGLRSLLR
jgi:uncharacterized protein YihD (DUF1040 family)